MDENKLPASEQTQAVDATETTACTPDADNAAIVKTTPEAVETTSEQAIVTPEEETEQPQEQNAPASKLEVIERLKTLSENPEDVKRAELEWLKQTYYRLRNAEVVAAREQFVADGGQADDFMPAPDADESTFKQIYEEIRDKRAQLAAEEEKEKQDNLKRKLEIIEEIKAKSTSAEEADKNFEAVKQLMAEWKTITLVPAENATELWKNYQLCVDHFYDQLHLNHEARMYDFKKNLEIKTQLCEEAEKLMEAADPVAAFHHLQLLHQEYRESGPVAKEQREEIWTRFKAASTAINKRHQEHFVALKEKEEENLQKKTALCEKVESLDLNAPKTFADWDKLTKTIIELQAEWKTIGFTPKKMNTKIFERFRATCDHFFRRKAEFFKGLRESLAANLEAKTKLAEAAEALKESTDWNETSKRFVDLQKQWKEIGPVAHKVSDAIWTRFNDACNYFFERKNAATGDQRKVEEENLAKKNEVIEALQKLYEAGVEGISEQVHDLQEQWNAIGHVPFRKKDKIYKKYREICDRIYNELHVSVRRRSIENFRKQVAEKGEDEISKERRRLRNALEAKQAEIKNYETNLSFFNSKSKAGDSLVAEITRKIERLRGDLEEINEKLKATRVQNKKQQAAEEVTPAPAAETEAEATPQA